MSDPLEEFVARSRAELTRVGLQRMELDGSVYWRGAVNGPTVVLLHGVNDQAGTWAPIAAKLAQQTHLIIPDLAGHGESAPKEGTLSLPAIVEKLHAIVDCEAPGKVMLVGNSMGGWISMLYTLQHPERVSRLALEDSSGMAWPLSVPLIANSREDAIKMYRAVNGPNAAMPEWAIESLLKQRERVVPMQRVMQSNVLIHLLDGRLADLHVPVTLIWGRDDGVLPVLYAEALQKKISGARLEVIEGAAHIPHRQQPDKFFECLIASF